MTSEKSTCTSEKRAAVVLAASRGIGFACAKKLAQTGHRVAIFSRSQENLDTAVGKLKEFGSEVVAVRGDLASKDDLEALFAAVDKRWGGTDILVNNNGGPPPGDVFSTSDEQWEQVFRGHVLPVLRSVRRVVPHMKDRAWGRIITIASIAVKMPIADLDLSNFVRGGFAGIHRTMARSLARHHINVHMVLPGAILTDRSRARIRAWGEEKGTSFEESLAISEGQIPKGRLGDPDEVGDLVAFLASDRADYLTGNFVQVDGGMFTGLA